MSTKLYNNNIITKFIKMETDHLFSLNFFFNRFKSNDRSNSNLVQCFWYVNFSKHLLMIIKNVYKLRWQTTHTNKIKWIFVKRVCKCWWRTVTFNNMPDLNVWIFLHKIEGIALWLGFFALSRRKTTTNWVQMLAILFTKFGQINKLDKGMCVRFKWNQRLLF